MRQLFLVRHDDVGKPGLCYGQTDFPSVVPYCDTAGRIRPRLPPHPDHVFASPLQRCQTLARELYPQHAITLDERLKEVNFGDWEARPWSEVDRAQLDAWAKTPIDFHFPGGEHLQDFAQRVFAIGEQMQNTQGSVVCVTHAGVIRLLLAQAQRQPWHACLSVAVSLAAVFKVKNGTYGQL